VANLDQAAQSTGVAAQARVYTKYVTGDATLGEARRVNEASRQALGGPPAMVQFHW
jgi:hypothetical protein